MQEKYTSNFANEEDFGNAYVESPFNDIQSVAGMI
jgi:hypothetical protein